MSDASTCFPSNILPVGIDISVCQQWGWKGKVVEFSKGFLCALSECQWLTFMLSLSDISTAFSKMNKVSFLAPTQTLVSKQQLHIYFIPYQFGSYCFITFYALPPSFHICTGVEYFSYILAEMYGKLTDSPELNAYMFLKWMLSILPSILPLVFSIMLCTTWGWVFIHQLKISYRCNSGTFSKSSRITMKSYFQYIWNLGFCACIFLPS